MFRRIITHDDFDGIVSAAICARMLDIDRFCFTGPRSITESRISVSGEDVVCDLPYPLECGLWFDHHEGNLAELRYRSIPPDSIGGSFAPKPSCARVVFEYFRSKAALPVHFESMVDEADSIDAFAYSSMEDWRNPTPGKILNNTLKLRTPGVKARHAYLESTVRRLEEMSLNEVIEFPDVVELAGQFETEKARMLEQIRNDAMFLNEDQEHQMIVLDFTKHNRAANIDKHLAYLVFSDSLTVIEVKNRFRNGQKTNDLSFSMSLSLNMNTVDHNKDVGEIFRSLNIGDGHRGAGAGVLHCGSKDEMLRRKEVMLTKIFQMWRDQ